MYIYVRAASATGRKPSLWQYEKLYLGQ